MNDTACRTIKRLGEDAATPEFHAVTTVRSMPNATTATDIPMIVKSTRSVCLNAFFTMSLVILMIVPAE